MRIAGTVRAAVVAVLAVLALGSGLAPSSAQGAPSTVRPGALVTVTASGFAPGAAVTVRRAGTPGQRRVRADPRGRVSLRYRAPQRPGRYRLTLVGMPPAERRSAPPGTRGPGDHQIVTVTVPRLVTFVFVVRRAGGAGDAPISAGGSSPARKGAGGETAVTGTDVALLALLAAALLGTGVLLAAAARRRQH